MDAERANYGWEQVYAKQEGDNLWDSEPVPFVADAIEYLASDVVTCLVDVGCGDGRNLPPLIDAGFVVTGIDASRTAALRAARRLQEARLPGFVLVGDVVSLPFAEASVAAITCFDAFSHFVDPSSALEEIRRVLRPDGKLVFNVFNRQDSEYGKGKSIAEGMYEYHGTMFRFYGEAEVRSLLEHWRVESCTVRSWSDPPHGEFRPYPHVHSSYMVRAVKG